MSSQYLHLKKGTIRLSWTGIQCNHTNVSQSAQHHLFETKSCIIQLFQTCLTVTVSFVLNLKPKIIAETKHCTIVSPRTLSFTDSHNMEESVGIDRYM